MNKNINQQVNGLRGLSCVLIVLFHVYYRYAELYADASIFVWMKYWGDMGVCIFLLISVSYLVNADGSGFLNISSLLKWYVKKVLRLWPTYAVAITITFIINLFFPLPGRETNLIDYLLNLSMVNGFIGIPYVDGAHWYLTVLLAFIFCFGILRLLRWQTNPVVYITWLLIAAILKYTPLAFVLVLCGNEYIGIACSAVAMKLLFSEKASHKIKLLWGIVLASGFAYTAWVRDISALICLSIAGSLVTFSLQHKLPCLDNRVCVAIGAISYPCYLIHQNISYAISYQLQQLSGAYSILFGVIGIAVTFILSVLLFYVVERPSQMFISKRVR